MAEWGPERSGRLRRQVLLVGCGLLMLAFAVQFAFNVLWPDTTFGALLLVLYLVVKVAGDRMLAGVAPEAPRMRSDQEWLHWLRLALPVALLHGVLIALGVTVAAMAAAAFPCLLFVADVGWLRTNMPQEPDAESLGRRLAAWP